MYEDIDFQSCHLGSVHGIEQTDNGSTTSSRADKEDSVSAQAANVVVTLLSQADSGSHDAGATTLRQADEPGVGSMSDTTTSLLTKCNICFVHFNGYVICNNVYIGFNQPIQCTCGCVVCTRCYTQSKDVKCLYHGTKLKTGLVNTTANILSHTRHMYTNMKWDMILDPNPLYKAPTQQNRDVQEMLRCQNQADLCTGKRCNVFMRYR